VSTCSVVIYDWTCDRPVAQGSLCKSHYEQARQQKRLRPLGPYRARGVRPELCLVDECSRDAVTQGLCEPHYGRLRRTGSTKDLRPQRSRHAGTVRDAEGKKECRVCGQWLLEGRFSDRPGAPDGLNSACRPCDVLRRKASRYGLTVSRLEEMIDAAGGVCQICGRRPTRQHIDHDHTCCPRTTSCGRCVRDLLCSNCNVALGLVGDSVDVLNSMISYLEKWKNGDLE